MSIERNKKRNFRQYPDWIAAMYPEYQQPILDTPAGYTGPRFMSAKEFTFQVTDDCNLACTYCYQTNKGKRRMKLETAKLAVVW